MTYFINRVLLLKLSMIINYNKVNNERRFEDFGYFTRFFNSKIPVINSDGNSTLFGDLINEYPCVVRYHYKNGIYTYSIYSTKENVDCALMASVYGGGGHKGAAGFQSKKLILPYKENLFTKLRNRWEVKKYYKKVEEIVKHG